MVFPILFCEIHYMLSTKKHNIPVKIVFVRNRNKKSEVLYLLSIDCSLSDAEIVRIYGNRWTIEVLRLPNPSLSLAVNFRV